jgi:shikimate dehydrogenase
LEISGRTRIVGIIADPISHVRTPQVLNPLMAQRDVNGLIVPVHVGAGDLARAWAGLMTIRNLAGLIVTVPHKTAVVGLADRVGPAAEIAGAANVVRREPDGTTSCDNFDGKGFVAGLRAHGHEPAGRRVLLLGAGGAGSAIAVALAEAGVGELVIFNRSEEKARRLAAQLGETAGGIAIRAGANDPAGFDIVVNATTLGLRPDDPLPCDATRLTPAALVADIIMQPETTPLLQTAQDRGCTIHRGRPMLDAQQQLLLEYLRLWEPQAPQP